MYSPPVSHKWFYDISYSLDDIIERSEFAIIYKHEFMLLREVKNRGRYSTSMADHQFSGHIVGFSGHHQVITYRGTITMWGSISDHWQQAIAVGEGDIRFLLFCFFEQNKP